MYFNKSCASYKIIFLRPKRSTEKSFQKKISSRFKKKVFGLFISHNRLLQTPSSFYWAWKVLWAFMMQVLRSILQQPRDCWKHKLWKKKAIVAIENTWGLFSRLTNRTNLKEQYKGFRMYFNNSFASYKIISVRPKRSTEKSFQKNLSSRFKKNFWPFFSHTTVYCRLQVVFYWAWKVFLGFYDASSKINSSTTKRFLKTQTLKKKILFQLKTPWAIFLVYRIG